MSSLTRRRFLASASSAAALVPALAQTPAPRIRIRPIEFGTDKMVFCDWWLVEPGYGLAFSEKRQKDTGFGSSFMPHGIRLRVGRPVIDERPALKADRPADGVTMGGYCTLLKDGGKYRLWYESYLPMHGADEEANICYAESDNGLDWTKPELGIIEFQGSKKNNLCYSRGHGGSIFIDPTAKPEERYKLIHLDKVPLQEVNGLQIEAMLFGAVSPDGIHWRRLPDPVIKHTSDTQSVAEYDAAKGKYVAYLRGWDPQSRAGYGGRRIVVRTESAEFGNFPAPVPVLAMGAQDPVDADIYTNAYQRWPGAAGAYLMTPAIYHRAADRVNLQLATSRDGVRWQFPQREAFLETGEPGSGYEGTAYAGKGTVTLANGNWGFPVSRYQNTHNMYFHPTAERPTQGGIWLAQLRQDGYMGIEAEGEGEFWTQTATFTGSRLLLNCWGQTGALIRVEIAEDNGQPVAGFSLAECDPVVGERLFGQPVTWAGRSDLSGLRGKLVRLRFQMRRVRLHAFQFAV
jgi:hypothetical protein